MNNYEEEMFQFLTEEKNFLTMSKLAAQYPIITLKLKDNLWDAVLKALQSDDELKDLNFKIWPHGKRTDTRGKILIQKENCPTGKDGLPLVAIAIQRLSLNDFPFFGPWINRDMKEYAIENIYDHLKNSKPKSKEVFASDDDNWFPFYGQFDINFKNVEDHLKLTGNRLDATVSDIVIRVKSLAISMQQDLEKSVDMKV